MKITLILPCFLLAAAGFSQSSGVEIASESDTINICSGFSITLTATGADSYQWAPASLFSNPSSSVVTAIFNVPTLVIVEGTSQDIVTRDSVFIDVDHYFFPTLINDTIVCENSKIRLARDEFDRRTIYNWSPGFLLNDSTIASPVAMPMESDTTFVLIATSTRGFCSDTDSVKIEIIDNNVEISSGNSPGGDTMDVCLGQPVNLFASADPPSQIMWSPPEFLSNIIGNSVVDTGKTSHYIYARIDNETCSDLDSIYVRIDSLPDIGTFHVTPIKEYYCVGDEIVIFSPSYDRGLYPDISHQWSPSTGFIDPNGNDLNTAIRAQVTTTYNRNTSNNACQQTDSILIRVVDPNIPVTPSDTMICPGESVQVRADATDIDGDLMWMPEDGSVVCTDITQKCDRVTITPMRSTMYMVTGTKKDCPASGMTQIIHFIPPSIAMIPTPAARVPIKTEATVTAVTNAQNATFMWEVDGIPFSTTQNQLSGTEDNPVTRTFVVTVTDGNGCVSVASIDVEWYEPPVSIQFPNLFTPDGNGENDFFRPVIAGDVVVKEMFVFNRWGQLVYNNDDPSNGWDGTNQSGKELPSDVYVFTATLIVNGQDQKFKGNITLLR